MHSGANVEIHRLALAHRALLPAVSNDPEAPLWRRFVDSLNIRPGAFALPDINTSVPNNPQSCRCPPDRLAHRKP
jgi:hypothetical protein